MSYAAPLAEPFYLGGGTTGEVPHKWDCSLNGRTYMYDDAYDGWGRKSIALLKPQQDATGNISEASLNPEEFARRAQESWHKGAGSDYLDRAESEPYRFATSKGVDPWTEWELSLLNDTSQITSSANTNLDVIPVGTYLYEIDGQQVYQRSALGNARASVVIHNGEGATTVESACTDGYYLYAALGANGIHRSQRGTTASSHYSDLQATLVAYVKGRLMAAETNSVYNVTASGAAPAALFDHPNSDWVWNGFGEGPTHIYMVGYSGDKSAVYGTTIKADGTALDIPTSMLKLPDGEIGQRILGYVDNFLLIGTDKGVRLAVINDDGSLRTGSYIPTDSPVLCFEPQEDFVWYGLTNYDSTSTGLGRMHLKTLNGSVPAYASDLMVTGQGAVTGVCTYEDVRVFCVSGLGFYKQTTDKVASGTVTSPKITFGLPDEKVAINLTLSPLPPAGSVALSLAGDDGTFTDLATITPTSTSTTTQAGQTRAERFQVRLTLTRDGTTTTTGPTVNRWTLEANPAPGRGEFLFIPLRLFDHVDTATTSGEPVDTKAEYEALLAMEASGAPVTFQDAGGTTTVFLDDHDFIVDGHNSDRSFFNGTFVCKLRRPRRRS